MNKQTLHLPVQTWRNTNWHFLWDTADWRVSSEVLKELCSLTWQISLTSIWSWLRILIYSLSIMYACIHSMCVCVCEHCTAFSYTYSTLLSLFPFVYWVVKHFCMSYNSVGHSHTYIVISSALWIKFIIITLTLSCSFVETTLLKHVSHYTANENTLQISNGGI